MGEGRGGEVNVCMYVLKIEEWIAVDIFESDDNDGLGL